MPGGWLGAAAGDDEEVDPGAGDTAVVERASGLTLALRRAEAWEQTAADPRRAHGALGLAEAPEVIESNPVTIQLRHVHALTEISANQTRAGAQRRAPVALSQGRLSGRS